MRTTSNLGLDVSLVGGGEQLRQALEKNFRVIDARALPAFDPVDDEGKTLGIVDGELAWVTPPSGD